MPYIKKLVMHGFKSFPKKTEIPFTPEINCVLGPNGSGKSNITDALCFVLGRLSAKSMRAAKSANLIFMGTKEFASSKEAFVELIFDNSDNVFSINEKEISIKRTIRKNGQGFYQINGQTKTRQEILSLLAQAGIDPNGFNIILQGEIQDFVSMHNEERRKIIEEVSGISVYELRKQKSIKELEKTDDKLKEVLAILRERTAYLNNLEKERQQALKFQKLEKQVKNFKASIINYDLKTRQKQKQNILSDINLNSKEAEKIKNKIIFIQNSVIDFEEKISLINSTIQKSTGIEQEQLNQEIANIRAELAGLSVRFENYENKLSEISKQKQELNELIRNNELSIKEIQKSSPSSSSDKKQKEIEEKKKQLEKFEDQRKKFYLIKSELKTIREKYEDKKNLLQNFMNESNFLLKQINVSSEELYDKGTSTAKISFLKQSLIQKRNFLEELNKKERELEKIFFLNKSEINSNQKLIDDISKIDTCPICKSKITKEHIHSISLEINPKVISLKKQITDSDKELKEVCLERDSVKEEIKALESEFSKREFDLLKIKNINEKKDQIKSLYEKIEKLKTELKEIEVRKLRLEKDFDESSNIEKKYETTFIEVQEISLRSRENVDSEIDFKQRELERSKISLKQLLREEVDYKEEVDGVKEIIHEKESLLEKKKHQEEALSKKFHEFIQTRDSYQAQIRKLEYELSNQNNFLRNKEQEINNLKIEIARVNAEIENFETEFLEFKDAEIISANKENLIERLAKTQEIISGIGSVNLRSLEVYESIKKEYDLIKEKADVIEKEKGGVLRIIHEIDIKKKKTFLKTLVELNEIFSRNFSQVNSKGQVYLEMENKQNPFEDGFGVQIVLKTGHGKYFDVKSLSGGEQTLVALSLIFAIQELNPYCFYILDEIDAALDKRNSERLAGLLTKYMQKGQYIIITHNDEIILSANNLYGVSMHDGVSKIISMRV
ncbi:MAG: chromosome segregation SMC family protein [Nanoarchaeota archaeon]